MKTFKINAWKLYKKKKKKKKKLKKKSWEFKKKKKKKKNQIYNESFEKLYLEVN